MSPGLICDMIKNIVSYNRTTLHRIFSTDARVTVRRRDDEEVVRWDVRQSTEDLVVDRSPGRTRDVEFRRPYLFPDGLGVLQGDVVPDRRLQPVLGHRDREDVTDVGSPVDDADELGHEREVVCVDLTRRNY